MCLKTQTIAKPPLKPLNPNAKPFHILSAATRKNCSSLLMLPHQIYGGQGEGEVTETHAQPPPKPLTPNMVTHQELRFPWVYGHDPSTMFLPEPRGAVSVFPHYGAEGTWCAHPPPTYHSCSFGFYTPSLQPHAVDLGNEKTLEVTRVPEWRADRRLVKKMEAKRQSMGRGRRGTAGKRVRCEWKARAESGKPDENTTVHHSIIPFPVTMKEAEGSGTTTVMVKNIPYQNQREDLLLMLDEHCFEQNKCTEGQSVRSMYDFVYLPMDYKKFAHEKRLANLGYAFVNFTTARAAFKFFQQFNGHKWVDIENKKACEVTSAQFQGKEALMKKFEEKIFRCVCPNFRPVEFTPARDGVNRLIRGTPVGKYAKGLPMKCIGRSQMNETSSKSSVRANLFKQHSPAV